MMSWSFSLTRTAQSGTGVKLQKGSRSRKRVSAVAVSMARGPVSGLGLLESLADELNGYALFHLARADMFRRLGQFGQARDAYRSALVLTQNKVERDFIAGGIESLDGGQ